MLTNPLPGLLLSLLVGIASADLYLHHPRGSNNKLNERQKNVRNDNRLFDSQNNANSGYNVGDDCNPACAIDTNNDNNAAPDTYNATAPGAGEGMMYYYAGSFLQLEWTAQHGCGKNNPHVDCEIIVQYACEDTMPNLRNGHRIATIGGGQNDNGQNTNDLNTLTGKTERESPNSTKSGQEYGQHEDYEYWMDCKKRERNKGLFTADKLQSTTNQQTSIYTRQGNNAERYGYECPEERDYYPFWHPSPWRDAIVLTDDTRRCGMYSKESQNVVDKGHCDVPGYKCHDHPSCVERRYNQNANQQPFDQPPLPNHRAACEAWSERYPTMPGTWVESGRRDTWPPRCQRTPYQRMNHHGNTDQGIPASVEWIVPGLNWNEQIVADNKKCVLRIRYNTSSKDFDGWDIGEDPKGVKANPQSDFVGLGYNYSGPLRLNINTAQFFRTFEDRSHVFEIRTRPLYVPFYSAIHNFNVRGKRGNVVQTYPSVEYDFVWSRKHRGNVYRWDFLHIQWTGSDANSPNDAGNGMQMTDRHNMVETVDPGTNFPKNLYIDETWERDIFGYRLKENQETGAVAERKVS